MKTKTEEHKSPTFWTLLSDLSLVEWSIVTGLMTALVILTRNVFLVTKF